MTTTNGKAWILWAHFAEGGEECWKFEGVYYTEMHLRDDFALYDREHDLLVTEVPELLGQCMEKALSAMPPVTPDHTLYDDEMSNIHFLRLSTKPQQRSYLEK